MGLFDALESIASQALASEGPSLLQSILGGGGLQSIVGQLAANGLGPQVQSWLGSGQNLPVSADQLKAALGNEQVQQIAAKYGVDTDQALKLLSQFLPHAVDAASPNGTLAQS